LTLRFKLTQRRGEISIIEWAFVGIQRFGVDAA
jgi:hypothetical protein